MNSPLDSLQHDEWDALIISIMKKFMSFAYNSRTLDVEDLQQEAWIALMRACKNFDPEKAADSKVKFSTYAYAYIEGQLTRMVRRAMESPECVDVERVELVDEPNVEQSVEDAELSNKIFELAQDEQHAELIDEHFVKGKSYRQIARELGVSHNLINLRIHALLNKIQEKLEYEDNRYNRV